jgi:hypothetical protein
MSTSKFVERSSIRNGEFASATAFWAVLVLSIGFTIVDATDGGVRAEALKAVAGLSLGALALTAAGWSIAVLCGFPRLYGNAPVLIGLGQIAVVTWMYLRSAVNAAAAYFVNFQWPVSAAELFVGIGVLLLVARRRQTPPSISRLLPSFSWIIVAIFVISQRELPREIMLSTDPDQHLFWTLQVLKFGGVPFSLGDWGPLDFQYPAGYALLSSLWALLSFTSAANSVTIQPILQSILAVLGIASFAALAAGLDKVKAQMAIGLVALMLFFGFFPFSLLKEFFVLQKTGSISTLLLFVTILALLFDGVEKGCAPLKAMALYFSGLGVAWSALINPVAVIIPAAFYYSAIFFVAWKHRSKGHFDWVGLLALAATPIVLMLLDPYYAFRFILQRPVTLAEIPPNFIVHQLAFGADATEYIRRLLARAEFVRPLLLLKYFAHPALSIVGIVAAFGTILTLVHPSRRSRAVLLVAAIPLICIAMQFAILPIFFALRNKGDLYLLEPYFMEAINRLAYLWYLSLLLICGAFILRRFENYRYGISACLLVLSGAMVPIRQFRDSLPNEVRAQVRYNYCVLNDCNVDDDKVVIKALQREYFEFKNSQKAIQFKEPLPRVLVPNQLVDVWRERWLFPVGTSKNLPANTEFPLAFFYYKGEADFNYKNYVENVCKKFDVAWLKTRRVKYMYLPTDRNMACVYELEKLLDSEQVIVKAGKSALIRIY